jgi:3-isopropylmalate/(R)-2-methylmalate dehydratase small subunit
MGALIELRGPAAALMQPDINTDIIAPLVRRPDGQQPVGLRSREELAHRLFGPWRYLPDSQENPDFVLNRTPFRQARFLVAGRNFACGSSRETAATMLEAFGIRCIIAPSFGQIFYDNCFRNHMLPLVVDPLTADRWAQLASRGAEFALDLRSMTISVSDGAPMSFTLPRFRQAMLVEGRDEVEVTLSRASAIDTYQRRVGAVRPWELLLRPQADPPEGS